MVSPYFAESEKDSESDRNSFYALVTQLPKPIMRFLVDQTTVQTILSIGDRYQLRADEVIVLSRIIRDAAIGQLFIKDMPVLLAQRLQISQTVTDQIINEVVQQLFPPILEDLKNIQHARFADRLLQERKSAPPRTSIGMNQHNIIDLRA